MDISRLNKDGRSLAPPGFDPEDLLELTSETKGITRTGITIQNELFVVPSVFTDGFISDVCAFYKDREIIIDTVGQLEVNL